MESQVTLDRVCSKEDFTVTGQNQQESIECLKNTKKKKKKTFRLKKYFSPYLHIDNYIWRKGVEKKKEEMAANPEKMVIGPSSQRRRVKHKHKNIENNSVSLSFLFLFVMSLKINVYIVLFLSLSSNITTVGIYCIAILLH